MKRFLMSVAAALAVLFAGLALPMSNLAEAATPAPAPQTFTVLVGAENAKTGVDVMGFFPGTVTIHAGDTVRWVANSIEFHTVSFGYPKDSKLPDLLAPAATFGYPMPPTGPGPLAVNPAAALQTPASGGLFTPNANSGLMGLQPGLAKTYSLTFPQAGDYLYVCLVHGWMMQGTVHVVGPNVPIASPQKSKAIGLQEIAAQFAKVPAVTKHAMQQIQPPTKNADGTMTYHVAMGYSEGMIDLMQFFPAKLVVRPGDTIVWGMGSTADAPHTVTFLNGTPSPDDVIPYKLPDGTVALYLNPQVLGPSPVPAAPLTRTGYISSGIVQPIPGSTYSLTIGNISPGPLPYICLLHDDMGMKGTLTILPRK
jgi:plastocyanin